MHLAIKDSLNIVSTLIVRLMVPLLMRKIHRILVLRNDIVIFLSSTLRLVSTFVIISRRLILSLMSILPPSAINISTNSVTR